MQPDDWDDVEIKLDIQPIGGAVILCWAIQYMLRTYGPTNAETVLILAGKMYECEREE